MTKRAAALSVGAIRLLVGLYPPRFRRRFGGAMVDAFEERAAERAERGTSAVAVLLVRTAVDLIVSAVREWVRPTEPRHRPAGVTERKRGCLMDHLGMDLRFALRSLARRPGFTVVAAVTLALGIGANTAIFSVVNAVLLRPLPYPDPDGIVMTWAHDSGDPTLRGWMSQADIESLRELPEIASIEGIAGRTYTLTGEAEAVQVDGAGVSGGVLETFGLSPFLGRDLRHDENSEAAPRVVVVSYDFWRNHLGGRRDAIGEMLELSERPYEVVGVAPEGFEFPEKVALWTPYRMGDGCGRGCHVYRAVARLAAGVPLARASANVTRTAAALSNEFPESNHDKLMRLEPLTDYVTGDVRAGLWILLGTVGVVLLIACANVANLLLVRASTRAGEVAVRTALGASRVRLIMQVMVESLVLATLGTAMGLLLAAGGIRLLKQLTVGTIPRIEQVGLDGTVLLFALAITFTVAMLFGLMPALRLARTPVAQALRREGRGGRGPREAWTGAALLATEVALSLILLVGAGLLLRSLDRLYRVDLGFDGSNVVRFTLSLPTLRYDSLPQMAGFYQGLEERIAALPGVESVGSARGAPMTGGNITGEVRITGEPDPAPGQENYAAIRAVTAGYLETMKLKLLKGRWIEATDRTGGRPVAVVTETFARQNFAAGDPIGKRIRVTASYGYADPEWEIVGVVRDVRRFLQGDVDPEIYVAHAQFGPPAMTVHVRARGDAKALIPSLRDLVHSADPNLALSGVETVDEAIRNDARATRLYLFLVSLFAGLAVTLAAVGLYGVVAYIVSRRIREIGIRLALGAPRMNIRRLVLAQGLVPAAIGIAAGLAVAIAASRVMRSILFEVEPADPLVLGGVSALVLVVAVAASLLPARRAARVDPVKILRME